MSRRTALRHARKVAAAAVVAAAAFGLTACQDNVDIGGSPSPAAESGGSGSADAGSGGGDGACATDQLSAGWYADVVGGAPDMSSEEQQTAAVRFENTSDRTCTMNGFPGVRLKDAFGKAWDLRRSAEQSSPATLKPGGHTHFTFQLLPTTDTGARKLVPKTVVVTPPNQKSSFELKWTYGGRILDQSGATRPGTFVNPVKGS
ncbi:DUF4232 domain-containing protein [Streptomyces sp. RTd22]|uniref:DUF4232 domain-containing protein n=1 Tax=Streptomyces sp. RTd22 TaxID=1841249 RepID=UPI0007C4F50C|nr:DUF4232 domain-containing protein [Streptomyces sp. RTd22]